MTAAHERTISRRQLLVGAGFGALGLGLAAISFEAGQQSGSTSQPKQPDNPFPGESIPISNPNQTAEVASNPPAADSFLPSTNPSIPEATTIIVPPSSAVDSSPSASPPPSEQIQEGFKLFTSPAGWPEFTIQYDSKMKLQSDRSISPRYVERFYSGDFIYDGTFIVVAFADSSPDQIKNSDLESLNRDYRIVDTNNLGEVPLGNGITADGTVFHLYDDKNGDSNEITWVEFNFGDSKVAWQLMYVVYTSQEAQFSRISNPMLLSFKPAN